ncbi:MAG: hypothetical protein CM1200mP14_17240 [Gammaproteobacteria bacterium]|nr:MAG: hypothetical protein CM1200mP14_17240 [Gammaproteobacteria bacterium]
MVRALIVVQSNLKRMWYTQDVANRQVLGVDFSNSEVRSLLEPLGFRCLMRMKRSFKVRVPGFRSYDVTREIDLIEELLAHTDMTSSRQRCVLTGQVTFQITLSLS